MVIIITNKNQINGPKGRYMARPIEKQAGRPEGPGRGPRALRARQAAQPSAARPARPCITLMLLKLIVLLIIVTFIELLGIMLQIASLLMVATTKKN